MKPAVKAVAMSGSLLVFDHSEYGLVIPSQTAAESVLTSLSAKTIVNFNDSVDLANNLESSVTSAAFAVMFVESTFTNSFDQAALIGSILKRI